jgi:hypothetical protein
VGVLVYPFRLVGEEVSVELGVGVPVPVRVIVGVPGVWKSVEVGVGTPDPTVLVGFELLHPTINAAGTNAIMIKQLISLFIFSNPQIFQNTRSVHGIR